MKADKLIGAVAALIQLMNIAGAVCAAQTVASSDKEAQWVLDERGRSREVQNYLTNGEMSIENGLYIPFSYEKYREAEEYLYTHEMNHTMLKLDATGLPVGKSAEGEAYCWLWGGKEEYDRFRAEYELNEKEGGEPIVISFDYEVNGVGNSYKDTPYIDIMNLWITCGVTGETEGVRYIDFYGEAGTRLKIPQQSINDGELHSMKVVIASERAENGRVKFTGIEADGVAYKTELYGKKLEDDNDVILENIEAVINSLNSDKSIKIENLSVKRGLSTITAQPSVFYGDENVNVNNVTIDFSEDIEFTDGAFKLYENNKEVNSCWLIKNSGNTVALSYPEYKSYTQYTIVMDSNYVKGKLGGKVAQGFAVNFSSGKYTPDLTPSENIATGDLKVNEELAGSDYTSISGNSDEWTITIDNQEWSEAGAGGQSEVIIPVTAEEYNNGLPLAVELDAWTQNAEGVYIVLRDDNGRYIQVQDFAGSEIGNWDSGNNLQRYAVNLTKNGEWRHVSHVVSPEPEENGKALVKMAVGEYETEVETVQTIAKENIKFSGTYNLVIRILKPGSQKLEADTNGKLPDSVIKLKNINVTRVKPLKAVIEDDCLNNGDVLTVKFSEKISEINSEILMITKGGEKVENAINSCTLSEDGRSAYITLSLDEGMHYMLDVSEVSDKYGIRPGGNYKQLDFDYGSNDTLISISEASVQSAEDVSTVNFMLNNGTSAETELRVIVAAYDVYGKLCALGEKWINAAPGESMENIQLENAHKACEINLMLWGAEDKIYCPSYVIELK